MSEGKVKVGGSRSAVFECEMRKTSEVRSDAQNVIIRSGSERGKRVLRAIPAELDGGIDTRQEYMIDDGVLGIGLRQRFAYLQRPRRLATESEGNRGAALHGALLVEFQATIKAGDGILAGADKSPVQGLLRDQRCGCVHELLICHSRDSLRRQRQIGLRARE